MGYVDFLLAGIPIFLFTLIPGLLIALPLLKHSKLVLYEKIFFGFIIGLVLPPTLLLLFSFIGIHYSLTLALLSTLLISAAGFAWAWKEDAFKELTGFKLDFDFNKKSDQKKLLVWGGLTLLVVWAFWARMQSLSPVFYEFDPYYYTQSTSYILKEGIIPAHDLTAWYPQGSTHRLSPLTNYLEAQWYSLYTQGGAYDNYLLSMVANVYPPLVGALLCFLLFILVKEEYGTVYGLVAALFGAVLPRFIQKFAAGEAEIQPWGLFALFFFFAAYSLLVHRKDKRLAGLTCIAALSVITGSQYFIILSLVYGGYLGVQSLLDFLRGKDLREFLELNGIVVAGIVLSAVIMLLHIPGYPIFERVFVVLAPYAFAFALYYISKNVKGSENKSYALLGIALACLIIFALTPVGARVKTYVSTAAGFAGHPEALFMTVAEEAPTGGELSSAFDVLGYQLFGGFTLIHLTLLLAAVGLLYGVYRDSRLAVLLALLIYPISYVGMSKSKYLLQLGFMLVIALAVVFGELEKFLRVYLKDEAERKQAVLYLKYVAVALAVIVLLEPSISEMAFKGAVVELTAANYDAKYWLATGRPNCMAFAQDNYALSYYLYCERIPEYWLQPMEWIKANSEPNARFVSWWDYGHWINYFGDRNCLTRNEHVNTTIDLMVADKFVFGPRDGATEGPAELAHFMREYNSTYVLFDYDLIGKWGALDFLACVYNNQTNMTFAQQNGGPGSSQCETDHQSERVFVPLERSVSDYCRSPDPAIQLVRGRSSFGYAYCIYETQTEDGYTVPGAMFYENNMSKQNKGFLAYPQRVAVQGKEYAMYTALYFDEASIWRDNMSGWDDRKGKYYDSSFYKGFFLGQLDGFTSVYEYVDPSSGQPMVRIYKLN